MLLEDTEKNTLIGECLLLIADGSTSISRNAMGCLFSMFCT